LEVADVDDIKGKVKLPPVSQVGMIVKDIDKVIQFYTTIFGIGPWVVREGEYRELKVRNKVYACKTKVAWAQFGAIELELFQVKEGRSLHSEFLDKDREGVHHFGFKVNHEEKERIIADLAKEGIDVVQAATRPNVSYAFLDTEKLGGGVFFELIEYIP
jgi:catechol 2,3-dioxygenase-like lactoylglutathione lyase family enzyme